MHRVVIGDTSAVIQLAIISLSFFTNGKDLEIVILPEALGELKGIHGGLEAGEPLKPFLEKLLNVVSANTSYKVPEEKKYQKLDQRLQAQESAMPGPKSAPTSPNDRFMLIVALEHKLHFCTREATLTTLAFSVMEMGKAWGVSDAIEYSLGLNIVKHKEVQAGLDQLLQLESLHPRCAARLADMGFRV